MIPPKGPVANSEPNNKELWQVCKEWDNNQKEIDNYIKKYSQDRTILFENSRSIKFINNEYGEFRKYTGLGNYKTSAILHAGRFMNELSNLARGLSKLEEAQRNELESLVYEMSKAGIMLVRYWGLEDTVNIDFILLDLIKKGEILSAGESDDYTNPVC